MIQDAGGEEADGASKLGLWSLGNCDGPSKEEHVTHFNPRRYILLGLFYLIASLKYHIR